jgi:hypothetical protein
MKVEVFYFQGCPNHIPTVERVRSVIQREGIDAEISEIEVPDERTAKEVGFIGSPTIRVNGLDIDPSASGAQVAGLSCRRYEGGLPSEDMIRSALFAAR